MMKNVNDVIMKGKHFSDKLSEMTMSMSSFIESIAALGDTIADFEDSKRSQTLINVVQAQTFIKEQIDQFNEYDSFVSLVTI